MSLGSSDLVFTKKKGTMTFWLIFSFTVGKQLKIEVLERGHFFSATALYVILGFLCFWTLHLRVNYSAPAGAYLLEEMKFLMEEEFL